MTISPLKLGDGYISHVKGVAQIPAGPHWVILLEESVTTWSGYKEDLGSSETILTYHAFTDEAKWLETVRLIEEDNMKGKYATSRMKYVAFHVDRRATVRVEVDVKVG